MMAFRIAWAIDIMVALVLVFFFLIGIADGSVSSFNIVLWLGMLGGIAALIVGANALARRGQTVLATVIAAVPALPALLYGLFVLVAVMSGARWN
jgi:hypothetical protein